jgi:lactoylglutathione lyase
MYKLAHIGMAVKDCEKSSLFYSKVLGCEKSGEHQDEKMKFIYLNLGNQIIELIQHLGEEEKPRRSGPIDHIAIEVEDINAAVARLKDLGIDCLSDSPREVFDGQKKIIFFLGPDGERIEFVQEC